MKTLTEQTPAELIECGSCGRPVRESEGGHEEGGFYCQPCIDEFEAFDEEGDEEFAASEPPCCAPEHDWSTDGVGGCTENPGVWGMGGTTLKSVDRCTNCGVRRTHLKLGSQRNPGERDSTSYCEADPALVGAYEGSLIAGERDDV